MTSNSPTFSIITVCFNEKERIKLTAESIIKQSYQDFEWIVIDGASTDGSVAILSAYSKYMAIFVSEKDKGIYDAMNKGLSMAKGKYVLFLNGGDHLYNAFALKALSPYLEKNYDWVYSNIEIIEGKNAHIWHVPKNIDKEFLYNSSMPHCATFIKRKLFEKYGKYNLTYKVCADYEWFVKVFKKHTPSFIHAGIVFSTFYRDGISHSRKDIRKKDEDKIRRRYYNLAYRFRKESAHYTFWKNALQHPRFLPGWIKNKFFSFFKRYTSQ